MKISELGNFIGARCVQSDFDDGDILRAYTSDLLSDILGNADEGCVLVTIQAHRNTVAVASTKDCPAIIVCNERAIPDDMIEAAKSERIALFETNKDQFTVSGMLYKMLTCGGAVM
ncbi:MAG: hypothetical protein J6I73_08710 [Treponema sp.]|nr:hypothetical protein [Treponema sp.]